MPSRIYSYFPERKITQPNPAANPKPGTTPAMPQKQGYSRDMLPGKASNGFAAWKKGVREVNGYAYYKGLSENDRFGANEQMRRDVSAARTANLRMQSHLDQEEMGAEIVNNAMRNKSNGYKADVGKLSNSDTAYGYAANKKKGLR